MYPQIFPVPLAEEDNFGWDGDPYNIESHNFNPSDNHEMGNDIFGQSGDPIVAPVSGKVTKSGWVDAGGWRIGIEDSDGWYHYLAHLQKGSLLVSAGDKVSAGQRIANMNQSGEAAYTSPHLHYGIQIDGEWQNGFYDKLVACYQNKGVSDVEGTVRYLYLKYLGRDPDNEGLANYVNNINAGVLTTSDVANSFRSSTERRNNINQYYQEVLHRDADKGGLDNYANSDLSMLEIYRALENSAEEDGQTKPVVDTTAQKKLDQIRAILG